MAGVSGRSPLLRVLLRRRPILVDEISPAMRGPAQGLFKVLVLGVGRGRELLWGSIGGRSRAAGGGLLEAVHAPTARGWWRRSCSRELPPGGARAIHEGSAASLCLSVPTVPGRLDRPPLAAAGTLAALGYHTRDRIRPLPRIAARMSQSLRALDRADWPPGGYAPAHTEEHPWAVRAARSPGALGYPPNRRPTSSTRLSGGGAAAGAEPRLRVRGRAADPALGSLLQPFRSLCLSIRANQEWRRAFLVVVARRHRALT